MSNLNNGHVTGHLAADPKVFTNSDGSKSVHLTLYVDRPYRDSEGNRRSDRIQLETYVRPETDVARTPFGFMHQGDLVALGFEVRCSTYADKQTGEVKYAQVLNVVRSLAAYGQEGRPCPRCGTPIRREALWSRAGRMPWIALRGLPPGPAQPRRPRSTRAGA